MSGCYYGSYLDCNPNYNSNFNLICNTVSKIVIQITGLQRERVITKGGKGLQSTNLTAGLAAILVLCSSVRNSFVSIYFSLFELFLPMNAHPPNTCSHFCYDLTTCSPPRISFRFHHSHPDRTVANIRKVDLKDLSKTGTIYSRGSPPGTFSHLIPYRKASPINSLDARSSTNS